MKVSGYITNVASSTLARPEPPALASSATGQGAMYHQLPWQGVWSDSTRPLAPCDRARLMAAGALLVGNQSFVPYGGVSEYAS